jgi:trans-aconitate 2-methyltransferase
MANPAVLEQQRYDSDQAVHLGEIVDEVAERLPAGTASRVLDLGCATGDAVTALAERRPAVSFTGLDVSEPSLAVARKKAEQNGLGDRASFVAGDYLTTQLDGPFDAVAAIQSLHLVPGSVAELCRKLASDLAPGGLLFAEMPYDSAYNRWLVRARRVLAKLQGRFLDRVALRLARLAHRDMPEEQLRQRLVYLYLVPERLADDRWEKELRAAGLELVERGETRQASFAQLKHRLSVYRKT